MEKEWMGQKKSSGYRGLGREKGGETELRKKKKEKEENLYVYIYI